MQVLSSLRQRRTAIIGVGIAQPSCESKSPLLGVLGVLGVLPSVIFAMTFSAYLFVGVLCVLIPPRASTSVAGVAMPNNVTCLRAARHADYVAAELNVGSPGRRVQVLVRWDRVVDATDTSLRLFDSRLMESRSLQCDGLNTTCADTILVNRGDPNAGFRRAVARFDYTAPALEMATYGVAAYRLRLGGEMSMQRGTRYWLTSTHVCFAPTTESVPATTSGALRATTSTTGHVVAPATALAHVSAAYLGTSYAREATVNFLCDNSTAGGVGTIEIFPVTGAVERLYLSLGDSHLFESEPSAISIRRKLVEVGVQCAGLLPWYVRAYNLYLLDCNNAAGSCATAASLPFRRVAKLNLVAHYDASGVASFRFETSPTMGSLPGLAVTADAVALAIVKLMLILFAAALVWTRSDRVTSKPHWLYTHCIQAAHCIRMPDTSSATVIEDATLGILAVICRFAVAMWRLDLLQSDSQSRVCVLEIIAAITSLVHWLARYWFIEPWLPDIVNGKSDGRGPLTRLGGSSAIIDASSSVLLAFSEPPLLMTAIPKFEPTARLLVGLLVAMVALPRCLFSAACCSLLYEAGELGKSRIEPAFKALLIASIAYWVFQTITLAVAMSDLVVSPLGFSIGRGMAGGTGWVSVALCLGFVAAGIPRLLSSCVKLGMPH